MPTQKTRLQFLRERYSQNPGAPLSKEKRSKLIANYKRAVADLTAYEKKRIELEAAEQQAIEDLIVALGVRPFEIDGLLYQPACRGDRVFFRRVSNEDMVKVK